METPCGENVPRGQGFPRAVSAERLVAAPPGPGRGEGRGLRGEVPRHRLQGGAANKPSTKFSASWRPYGMGGFVSIDSYLQYLGTHLGQ